MPQGPRWLPQSEHDFVFARVPRLCIDIVIVTKDGVLLSYRTIQPAKHTWHTPGGRVHFGESIEHAVRRIAKEETGLTVRVEKMLGFMEFRNERQGKNVRHTVSLAFLVHPIGGALKPDKNAASLRYFKKFPPRTHAVHRRFLAQEHIL
jgi:ADP-ribose pyrophosphatase YjhB (NUDIX family)